MNPINNIKDGSTSTLNRKHVERITKLLTNEYYFLLLIELKKVICYAQYTRYLPVSAYEYDSIGVDTANHCQTCEFFRTHC